MLRNSGCNKCCKISLFSPSMGLHFAVTAADVATPLFGINMDV